MFALVYASAATTPFDDAALQTLAEKAGDKNRRLQITGYLNYNPGRRTFFQYLEGPQQAVLDLMADIEGDDRHQVLNVVQLGEIESRLFPKWSMRYLNAAFFNMIHMEDVLEGVLVTMSEKAFDRAVVISTVHRIAKRIAERPAS